MASVPDFHLEDERGLSIARDWAVNQENPRNWPFARRVVSTAVVSGIGFVSTMGASIYSPGHDQVSTQFDVTMTVSLLPLSLYNLGMAFGPIISSPLSETFGRKAVYLTTTPIFALFILGSGFAQNIGALSVCRFFAGVFGSPGVSLAAATIADISAPVDRANPLAVYYAIPFLGSLLGVLIGGFVVESKGWRWTQWTVLFFTVAFLSPVLFIHESYKKTIIQRRTKKLGVGSPSQRSFATGIRYFMTKSVIRPLHMLFTELIVGSVCLYTSFQFALLYTFVVASPYIFATAYNFSLGAQGLSFLGFITGCLVSPIPIILMDRYVYQPKFARFKETARGLESNSSEFPPEHRLYCAMIGSVILPAGLFAFAWSAKSSVHWIWPIVAQAFAILGSLLIYVAANLYMMDVYGPLYGASATGATSLARYTLAMAFPLFTLQMYEGLGVAWATSLLGFCTLAMAPIPWVFYHWGPKLRARSNYARES